MGPGLTADMNSGVANAEMVGGSWDRTEGGRHQIGVVIGELTGAVDGERPANGVPYIPSRLGQ